MPEDLMWKFPKKAAPEISKGDFVMMKSSGFVGQVVDNNKRGRTRMVHTFGMAEETGSVYAEDMMKISEAEFESAKSTIYNTYQVDKYRQWSDAEMAKQEAKKHKLKDVS